MMASARNHGKGPVSDDVRLSKSLSWLLRHGVQSVGLTLQPGGYLYVSDVLKLPQFSRYSLTDIQKVVASNDKQRFALSQEESTGSWMIRANQGHSIQVDNLDLKPIVSASEAPVVVHGTKMAAWQKIKTQGLSRMGRNHIHFAAGEPGDDGVISGMRQSSAVMIYLDVNTALSVGIKLLRSANNVILSPGQEGVIPPSFFSKVIHRPSGGDLTEEPSDLGGAGCLTTEGAVVTADDLADEMDGKRKRKKKKKGKRQDPTGPDDG